jgi:hypothetical protein
MRVCQFVVMGLLLLGGGNVAAQAPDLYIEFLWSKLQVEALARQQTRQFVMQGDHGHQICIAANAVSTDVGGLQIELRDAEGAQVSLQQHDDYRGIKRCYPADLAAGGAAGDWTVHVVLGDGRTGTAKVRVDPRIEDSPHYLTRSVPYVAGRPNYDASIPAGQWVGRLVWAMDVDPQGHVTHVEVEVAEGVGERLRERAIAAGYLTVFPPDPGRATQPLRWRRALAFAPE